MNTKISALTAGAPAVATDLIPIDRSGTNYSLLVSDIGAEILASAALSGTPTAPTPTATTNNTDIATAAFVGSQIVDGTPAANSIGKVVASLVLTAQTAVDGSASAHNLYTVTVAGVYRVCGFAVARTKNSGAWTVNVDITWPSGTNFSASALQTLNMVTPSAPSSVNGEQMYLHVSDAITCGTATGTGSRDSGIFDVSWTVERIV